jgi:hypothetical protein
MLYSFYDKLFSYFFGATTSYFLILFKNICKQNVFNTLNITLFEREKKNFKKAQINVSKCVSKSKCLTLFMRRENGLPSLCFI